MKFCSGGMTKIDVILRGGEKMKSIDDFKNSKPIFGYFIYQNYFFKVQSCRTNQKYCLENFPTRRGKEGGLM